MSVLDVATLAVLAFIGVRIAGGARIALTGKGRRRVLEIVRGLRPVHFLLAVPTLIVALAVIILLLQIPLLDWGWWAALGGLGNPVTGGTERTSGTPLEWLVPLVFIVLLLPALPLFAEAEESMFRRGAQRRSAWGRFGRSVQFGLAHALIGIPIGAALGLTVGGTYFTWRYMRVYKRTGDERVAMLESTRAHLGYNLVAVVIIAFAVLAGSD